MFLPVLTFLLSLSLSVLASAQVHQVIMGGEEDGSARTLTARATVEINLRVAGCTGTLIARDVVLTAAHCFLNNPSVQVSDVVVSSSVKEGAHFITKVESAVLHPQARAKQKKNFFGLRSWKLNHDLAILFLRTPAPPPFQPVHLPELFGIHQGCSYAMAGFGKISPEVALPGHRRKFAFEASSLSVEKVDSEQVWALRSANGCSGGGDSGGPVMEICGDTAILIGVHRAGNCGGDPTKATSYSTVVFHHLDWILETIRSRGVAL